MCRTCGCGGPDEAAGAPPLVDLASVPGVAAFAERRRLERSEARLLARNDAVAAETRARLRERGVLALNLVSSPGAGKTTLLERTIRECAGRFPLAVIEGDQATDNDAARIRATGAPVVQVNTGQGCHLDAPMVARALETLAPPEGAVLFIENVGNLVCPALFDLGERAKVVLASVTEGEDKPLKYPHIFRASALLLLSKCDLLPHLRFDADRCLAHAREVSPAIGTLRVSSETGLGLESWYNWIAARRAERG